jgi:hypothetical protein
MRQMSPTDERAGQDPGTDGSDGSDAPDDARVAALRGAGVEVDSARLGRAAATLAVVTLVVVAGILLVAGYRKNSQIDALQSSGVPVHVTVTRCLALIGGTGQTPAGYECSGTYTFRGQHYTGGLPGDANIPVGSVVNGVVSSGDPALLSTPVTVADEHPSATVYLLPAAILCVSAGTVAWIAVRRRRRRTGG